MATEIKWADGQAITADSTIRWADGQPFVYYYEEAAGASSTPSSTLARGIAVGMFKGMGIGSGQYP